MLAPMRSRVLSAASIATLLCGTAIISSAANCDEAAKPPVLAPGRFRVAAAGGAASVNRSWTYAAELSARAGISRSLEIAGPLALGVALVDAGDGSGLVLGGGIVDLWIAESGVVLWSPAVALSGRFRTSTTSSLRAFADLTGAERDLASGEHPAWIRGGAAFLIDLGRYATIAAGASYQRRLVGDAEMTDARRLGWAGDARGSFISGRTEPFEELPALAVHLSSAFDLIAVIRIDIDMDDRTTDARYLLGLRLDLSTRGE
jgi:hypothetical protein